MACLALKQAALRLCAPPCCPHNPSRPAAAPAGLLWSLAPRLAVFLVIYAVGGTWITVSGFGRRLMHLTYSVLQKEADLRFALVRGPSPAAVGDTYCV